MPQVLSECPAILQFIFWVAVIGGGGYCLRILNKTVHRRQRRLDRLDRMARERQ